MRISFKKFSSVINSKSKSYENIKRYFEEDLKLCKITNLSTFCISDPNLTFMTEKNLITSYKHIKFELEDENGKMKKETFILKWLNEDENPKVYKKMEFLPNNEGLTDEIYNLWNGWEFQKNPPKKSVQDFEKSYLKEHIYFTLCDKNDDVYNYFLHSLAYMIKTPNNRKKRTAMIFKGAQNIGKDLFYDWFGLKILGEEYYHNTENIDILLGKFGDCLSRQICIVLNEMDRAKAIKYKETIKACISAKRVTINPKGKTPFTEMNCATYTILTNNDESIILKDTDTRFIISNCSNELILKIGHKEYFDRLSQELENNLITESFINLLLSLDVQNFEWNNIPKTESYYKELALQAPAFIKWFVYIENNYSLEQKIELNKIEATKLYDKFIMDCKSQGIKDEYLITYQKFGRDITSYFKNDEIKKTKNSCMQYQICLESVKMKIESTYRGIYD